MLDRTALPQHGFRVWAASGVALLTCVVAACEVVHPQPAVGPGPAVTEGAPPPPHWDGGVLLHETGAGLAASWGTSTELRRVPVMGGLRPLGDDGPPLGLHTVAWGRQSRLSLPAVEGTLVDDRVERNFGPFVEWWKTQNGALEFGFDLYERPEGEGPLWIALELSLEPGRTPVQHSETEVEAAGLRIDGLAAWDATGQEVPARFVLDGTLLQIEVEDAGAELPITIDPLVTPSTWSAEADEAGAIFGTALSGIGDADADGYGDLAVGAPGADTNGPDSGALHIFFGGPLGPGYASDQILSGAPGQRLGTCVSNAGDVNGDGFSDLLAGGYTTGGAGTLTLWYGTATGFGTAPSWSYTSPQVGADLGFDCGSAGDVQGDGYADLLVGAPLWDDATGVDRGAAFGFYGGPAGPAASPSWSVFGEAAGDLLGSSISSAGDHNGDGHSDVVVGAPGWASTNQGAVYVWYGSATGLGASPTGVYYGNTYGTNCALGTAVAGVGDLDGDGFGEILATRGPLEAGCGGPGTYGFYGHTSFPSTVFSPGGNYLQAASAAGDLNGDGRADALLGGLGTFYSGYGEPDGIYGNRLTTLATLSGSGGFGLAIAPAGDVNGDGFADVLVGAPQTDAPSTDEGRAYLYLGQGGATYASNTPSQTVGVGEPGFSSDLYSPGDINGDGYDDLAAGNSVRTNDERVRIFHGGPGGLSVAPVTTLLSPNPALDIDFGTFRAGTSGDLTGDGFADLVVSAPGWDNGQTDEGKVWLHAGTAGGLLTTPTWLWEPDVAGAQVVGSVAGDVMGDGISDLLVAGFSVSGAPGTWFFAADGAGVAATPSWSTSPPTVETSQWTTAFGLGDVNCDGYDDVLAASPYADAGFLDAGSVAIHLGSPAGPLGAPAWSRGGTAVYEYLGTAAAGVDLNGDGCGDFIVARQSPDVPMIYLGDPGLTDTTATVPSLNGGAGGRAGLAGGDFDGDGFGDVLATSTDYPNYWGGGVTYLGDAAGGITRHTGRSGDQQQERRWDGATGDWNGDGFDDLILGASGLTTNTASAYLYFGNHHDTNNAAVTPMNARATGPGGEPIAPRGRSTAWDSLTLHANGRAPWGRADVALEADLRPARSSWDDPSPTLQSPWADAGVGPAPAALSQAVDGLANHSDHQWRLRIRYADTTGFPQLWGPWHYGGLPAERVGVHVRTAMSPDTDLDLWPDADDCAPLDAAVHPGATELVGDEVDQDCDGAELCWADADGDGGVPAVPLVVPSPDGDCQDEGEAALSAALDCDDADPEIGPAAPEVVGDGADQDCDGDELCWADADWDGHWSPAATVPSTDLDCTDYGEHDGSGPPDCDDAAPTIHVGASEVQGSSLDEDCDGVELCFADFDADGFRSPAALALPSTDSDCADPGEASISDPATDCDDAQAGVHPGVPEQIAIGGDEDCDGIELCYADTDGDGYRPPLAATVPSLDGDCADAGEALPSDPATDCNDAAATVFPGQSEAPGDELDGNCDGAELCWSDLDGDGARTEVPRASLDLDCADPGEALGIAPSPDCDDASPSVRPGAVELPGDGLDQDCDGTDGALCRVDADGDGWGGGSVVPDADGSCADDPLQVDTAGDCDDGNPARNPGAVDVAGDGVDQDCDGGETCYVDADGDGFRPLAANLTVSSSDPDCDDAGEALALAALGDCDDAAQSVRPGATELPFDGIDQDCDGMDAALCHYDLDGDGFGSIVTVADLDGSCADAGQSANGDDCDDGDGSVHPGAPEGIGDNIDQNCDDSELCWVDADSDGYRPVGDGNVVASADPDCGDPGEGGTTEPASDCDDADPNRSPGTTEQVGDGFDADCDGSEQCLVDADDDGFRPANQALVPSADLDCDDAYEATGADLGGDCDDTLALVFPGADEWPADGIDQDCDGGERCPADGDLDGFPDPVTLVDSVDADCFDPGEGDPGLPPDCDDGSPSVHPGAPEFDGDLRDQDCDGFDGGGACAEDSDGDQWVACLDCDDADPSIHPMAAERCDGADTDCDPATPEPFADDPDGDGLSACDGDCGPFDPWVYPGAPEGCDGLDADCDGSPDGAELDGDGDGERRWPCGGDCDDADPSQHPQAAESVAGPDRNCDGLVGPGDADGDGFGLSDGDCDDGDGAIYPGADEICDGLDGDCDSVLSAGEGVDRDRDGARACEDCDDLDPRRAPGMEERCNGLDDDCDGRASLAPEIDRDGDGRAPCAGDCDDGNGEIHAGRAESCDNGLDDDCDGSIDVDRDEDQDGARACSGPDCDDHDAAVGPAAPEICDGRDNDCDGEPDDGHDVDADGRTACGDDCDDTEPGRYAHAAARCDDAGDEDCFPSTSEVADADGDGFSACSTPQGDCWEGHPQVFPGQAEHCDGLDNDCDGAIDEGLDADGDGAAPCVFDCDDGEPLVGPHVDEIACDGLDNDCDGQELDVNCEPARPAVIRPFGCSMGGTPSALDFTMSAFVLLSWAARRRGLRRGSATSDPRPRALPAV